MTTPIGFVIQPGESIPDDVTGVDDNGDGNKAWERVGSDAWRCIGTKLIEEPGKWVSEVYGPLTVTAVREQPAEPEPVSTQLYWSVGTPAAIDGLKGVYTTEEAANAAKAEDSRLDVASIYLDRAYPVFPAWDPDTAPAPEPESVDVIEVVRLFGRAQYTTGYQISRGDQEKADRAVNDGGELFARIEAEVNRLRAEADHARAELKHHLDSVDRLAGERNEALAEVERWRERVLDLLPDPSSPLVLRLPEVPEGAVALVDRHERRWRLSEMTDLAADGGGRLPLWESGSGALRTYSALLAGSGPLTVVMAPPREPRTWAPVEIPEASDLPAVVDVDGHGRWTRIPTDHEADDVYEQYGQPLRSFGNLRTLGEVREVFDDKDGTR